MNERIRELASEVGISVEYLTNTKQIELLEKFAELIVRECIQLCDQVDLVGADDCIDNIKQHFEIEE